MVRLFEGARQEKKYVLKSIVLALVFWLIQFAYQFYVLIPNEVRGSLIRSFALVAATLIGIALLVGPLAKIFPSRNYVFHRRTLGVLGFTFGIMHVATVMLFLFNLDFLALFWETNPYVNPLIFGILSFLLYMPLYITSTDWATEKMGFRRWKLIHRIVYIVWIFNVLHFVQINPALLMNPAGYLLLAVTALVFIFEIAAFAKTASRRKILGMAVGIAIILIGAALFYLGYAYNKAQSRPSADIIAAGLPVLIAGFIILFIIIKLKQRKKTPALQPSQQLEQQLQ